MEYYAQRYIHFLHKKASDNMNLNVGEIRCLYVICLILAWYNSCSLFASVLYVLYVRFICDKKTFNTYFCINSITSEYLDIS